MADPTDGSQGAQKPTEELIDTFQQRQWVSQLEDLQQQWLRTPAQVTRRQLGLQHEQEAQGYERTLQTVYEQETQAAAMRGLTDGGQGAQSLNERLAYTTLQGQRALQSQALPREETRSQSHRERRTQRHKSGQVCRGSRGGKHNAQSSRAHQVPNRSHLQGPAPYPSPSPATTPQSNYPRSRELERSRGWSRGSVPARFRDGLNRRPAQTGSRSYNDRYNYPLGTVLLMPTTTMVAAEFNVSTELLENDSRFTMTVLGPAFTEYKHYIICASCEGSYRCLMFQTYGGQALEKHGISDAAAQNHAVVYASGQPVPREVRTTRDAIEVIMDGNQPLHEKSRLDLRKIYPVEMNLRFTRIGELTPRSWDVLKGYIRETHNEELSQLSGGG